MAGAQLRFGKYTLLQRIATGGMGEVHLAKLRGPSGFEKLVVIKRLLETRKSTQHYIDMFFSEARVAAQLGHSNIVQIYEVGQIDGVHYIAMEYVQGKSLRQILNVAHAQRGFFPAPYCLDVVAELCAGLSFAHNAHHLSGASMGLIHRDVNPHNVLVSYQGEVKIIDFGIAKSELTLEQTQAGTIKGTVVYMSPEQANGKRLDKRSDIFSVGICLYEALTGENPFFKDSITGSLEAIRQSTYVPIEQGRPELLSFAPIVARALQRDPAERYQDCSEMAQQLRELRDSNVLARPPQRLSSYLQALFINEKADEERLLSRTELVEIGDGSVSAPTQRADTDATQVRPGSVRRGADGVLEDTAPAIKREATPTALSGDEATVPEPPMQRDAEVITEDRRDALRPTPRDRPTQPITVAGGTEKWPLFLRRGLGDLLALEAKLQGWAQAQAPLLHAAEAWLWGAVATARQRLQPIWERQRATYLASRRAQGALLGGLVALCLGIFWLTLPAPAPPTLLPEEAPAEAPRGAANLDPAPSEALEPAARDADAALPPETFPAAGTAVANRRPHEAAETPSGRRTGGATAPPGRALVGRFDPPAQWVFNGSPVSHDRVALHGSRGLLQIGSGTDRQNDPFAVRIRYRLEGQKISYSVEADPWANVFGPGGIKLGRTPLSHLGAEGSISLELQNPHQHRHQRIDLDLAD